MNEVLNPFMGEVLYSHQGVTDPVSSGSERATPGQVPILSPEYFEELLAHY